MTAVDELLAFLRDRLNDEYALARRVADRYTVRNPNLPNNGQPYWPLPSVERRFDDGVDADILAGLDLIKAYNPQRVLAEVEAKRAILDWAARAIQVTEDDCYQLGVDDVLRLLAQPYAGRDGWREEWRA